VSIRKEVILLAEVVLGVVERGVGDDRGSNMPIRGEGVNALATDTEGAPAVDVDFADVAVDVEVDVEVDERA
jgi:hypothetical protein